MPDITLTFSTDINASLQVGDTAYYCPVTAGVKSFSTSSMDSIVEIGVITNINGGSITCDAPVGLTYPTVADFILFSKDNKVNMSSLLGYYGLAKIKNNSSVKSEMFAVSCDIFESSK